MSEYAPIAEPRVPTDLNDAMLIVDQMREHAFSFVLAKQHYGTQYRAEFAGHVESYRAWSERPEQAIYEAARKALAGRAKQARSAVRK